MHPLYEQMETSVFERMSLAAAKHGAINLGQGFPDFGWPPEILDAAAKALVEGSNQYAPSRGLPALREAVAAHYGRHQGLSLMAENICVTSGATEALAAAILATVEPGDEVMAAGRGRPRRGGTGGGYVASHDSEGTATGRAGHPPR